MSVLEENIARAEGYIARFRKEGVMNHVGGQSRPAASGRTFATVSPVDLSTLAQVAKRDAADVDAAVAAAKAAFPAWSGTPGAQRRKILIRVAEAIEARAEEIAFTECMDTGQALRFMSKAGSGGPRTSASSPTRRPRPRTAPSRARRRR